MSKSKSSVQDSQLLAARESFVILEEISKLLNTGLDRDTLSLCVRLCENGANPEALATVIRELKRESAAIRQQEEDSSSA